MRCVANAELDAADFGPRVADDAQCFLDFGGGARGAARLQARHRRGNADGGDNVALGIPDRRGHAPDFRDVLAVVEGESHGPHFRARAGESRHRPHRGARVDRQPPAPEQIPERGEIAVGEQRLAVRGAVQRREFPGLAGDGDDLPGGDLVIDEEHLDALAYREVRRLAERRGELLQLVMKEHPERVTAVPQRQPPRSGAQDVVPAALRVGQEPALPQGVYQPEDAAAIDPDEIGELFSGTGCGEAATASRIARPRSRLWIGSASWMALPLVTTMSGGKDTDGRTPFGIQWRRTCDDSTTGKDCL